MGYGRAPWIFKGSAFYQLQLVPTEEARKYIPPDFKIVSLFGHTLGGFYLARYTDSPVGAFDELVAMAGLVWNFPTSCAWAARVYVSNREARDHGIRSVGLPSRVASFSPFLPPVVEEAPTAAVQQRTCPPPRARFARPKAAKAAAAAPPPPPSGPTWWEASAPTGPGPSSSSSVVLISAEEGSTTLPVCGLALPPAPAPGSWPGPRLSVALPSFSGGTPACPALLQYACALATRVRPLPPARVLWPAGSAEDGSGVGSLECLHRLLRGRPLLALQFGDMTMTVAEPQRVDGEHRRKASSGGRRRAALLA